MSAISTFSALRTGFALKLGLAAVLGSFSFAQSAEANCDAYFEGQRFDLVLTSRAGGGYDTYARAFEPVFEEATGATLVVNNLTGAGGAIALSRILESTEGDRVFGFFGMGAPVELPTIDADKFIPVVSLKREQEVWISAADFDFEAALDSGKMVMGTNRISGAVISQGMTGLALGVKVQILGGYDGAQVTRAALLRGETDADNMSSTSGLRAADTGDFKVVMSLTKEPIEGVDAPTLKELVEERLEGVSDEEKTKRQTYLDVATGLTQNMRAFWVSADLDEETRACISDTVLRVAASPEFKAAAEAVNRPVEILDQDGAVEVYENFKAASAQSEALIEELLPLFE